MEETGNEERIFQYLIERTIQTDEEMVTEAHVRTICTETENLPLQIESVKKGESHVKNVEQDNTMKSSRMQKYSLLRQDRMFFAVPQTPCSRHSATTCASQALNIPCSNVGDSGEIMPLGTIIYIGPGTGVPSPTRINHFFATPSAITSRDRHNGELENGAERNSGLCGLRGKPQVCCGTGKKSKQAKESLKKSVGGKAAGDNEIKYLRSLLQPIKQTVCRLKEISKANEATGDNSHDNSCKAGELPPTSKPNAHSNWSSLYKTEPTCQDCGARLAEMGLVPDPDTLDNSPTTSFHVRNTNGQKENEGTDRLRSNKKPLMKSDGIQCGTGVCHALSVLNDYQKSLLLRFANRNLTKMKSSSVTLKGKDDKSTEIVWPAIKKRRRKVDDSTSKMSRGKRSRTPIRAAKKDQLGDGSLDLIDSIKEFDPAMVNKSTQTLDGSKRRKQCRKGCCNWNTSISRTSLKSRAENKEQDIATITYDKNDSFTSPASAGIRISAMPIRMSTERSIPQTSQLDIAIVQSTKAMSALSQKISQSRQQRIFGRANATSMIEMTVTRFTQRIEQVTGKVMGSTAVIADVDDREKLCPCGCGYFQEGASSDCSCGCEVSSQSLLTHKARGDSKKIINQDFEPKEIVCRPAGIRHDGKKPGGETKEPEECLDDKPIKSTVTLKLTATPGKASATTLSQKSELKSSRFNKELDDDSFTAKTLALKKSETEEQTRDELSKPTVVTSMKGDCWDFDKEVETLQESIKMYKEENENLRSLIAKCQCLGDRVEEISQQPPIRGTSSAIEILQSKCSSKDGMITALAGALRGTKNLDEILRSLLSPCLQYVHLDFDPCAMFVYLRKLSVSLTVQNDNPLTDAKHISQNCSTVFHAGDCDRIQIPQPRNFQVAREICKCLLVSWDLPKDISKIIGYDISVNGSVVSRVRSPTRTNAMLGSVSTSELLVISICSVDNNDRFSDPITITYTNTCD